MGNTCISELWLLLPFHLKWLYFLFSVCMVPTATAQNIGPVPSSLLALAKLPFISLGALLLVVSFHWEFFQLCFADKVLGKGKTRPWGRGLRCNFSVNVLLHFYTNRVLTKIILLLWAFSTDVPVNEFPEKRLTQRTAFKWIWGHSS